MTERKMPDYVEALIEPGWRVRKLRAAIFRFVNEAVAEEREAIAATLDAMQQVRDGVDTGTIWRNSTLAEVAKFVRARSQP